MTSIHLMKLLPKHYADLRRIRNQNKAYFVDSSKITIAVHKRWIEEYIRSINSFMYAIYCKDAVVGFIGITIDEYSLKIDHVMIDDAYKRRGIMESAMSILLKKISSCYAVNLHVLKTNTPAIRLYRKLGFDIVREDDICYNMEK